jgi:glycosyltransferase involved in cell wall biosynthesis
MSTATPAREPLDGAVAATLPPLPRMRVASLPPVLETNPYQRLLYAELARAGLRLAPRPQLRLAWLWRNRRSVGLLHFHWPEAYYRYGAGKRRARRSWLLLALFTLRLVSAKALGYRIAWTIHQVRPHESGSPRIDRLGSRALAAASDVLLTHDGTTARRARQTLGRRAARVEIVPHGSYVGFYPAGRSREAVRAELGIDVDSFTFLCFGDLRAYKEVELLLDAFAAADLPSATLVLAGGTRSERLAQLVREAEVDPRVRTLLGFVPDSQVAELFGACDAAVLARGDGGTSGSLILALSLGLPLVAARRPSYEELMAGKESGWLFEPGDCESLRRALEAAAADPAEAKRRGASALRRAKRLAWPEIGDRTARILLRALEGRA